MGKEKRKDGGEGERGDFLFWLFGGEKGRLSFLTTYVPTDLFSGLGIGSSHDTNTCAPARVRSGEKMV